MARVSRSSSKPARRPSRPSRKPASKPRSSSSRASSSKKAASTKKTSAPSARSSSSAPAARGSAGQRKHDSPTANGKELSGNLASAYQSAFQPQNSADSKTDTPSTGAVGQAAASQNATPASQQARPQNAAPAGQQGSPQNAASTGQQGKSQNAGESEQRGPGATRNEQGQVTGFQDQNGGNYDFQYGDDGQLSGLTDASGTKWSRQQDGTWKGDNGQTMSGVNVDENSFSMTRKNQWGQETMDRFDLKDGSKTQWEKGRGDEQFHRELKNGDDRYLYNDGSTVDRDHAGRITGFDGTGGIHQEIDKISKMTDPVQRNLQITQMYSDLSNILNKQIPGGGANWATWATHASNEAGSAIRGEKVPQGYSDTLDSVHKTTRMAIGRGNNMVFTEIAPQLASFSDTLNKMNGVPDQGAMDKFKAGLNGKPALQNAFQDYYDAAFSKNPKDRQAHMLKGNVRIGVHEQLHLDNMIDTAMPGGNVGRQLATRTMMNFPLPGGQNVSMAPAGDWSNFGKRMEFIQNIFTDRHMDPSLFQSPFSTGESADIINGHVPRRFR